MAKLLSLAYHNWVAFDGWALSTGRDLHQMEWDRALNLIYHWATYRADDPDEVAKFDRHLWQPPKGLEAPIPAESPWSAENETSAFQQLFAEFNA